MGKKNTRPSRRNPLARELRENGAYRSKAVRPKKGRGAYRRKLKHRNRLSDEAVFICLSRASGV